MSISVYFTLISVCLLGAMTPGPSLLVVSKNTLAGGRLNGVVAAWSHALVIGGYALLAVTGLAVLMQQLPLVFELITYAGGVYLAYLGVKALLAKGAIQQSLLSGDTATLWHSAKDGFLISILNPKITLFFIALFSQFVATTKGLNEQTLLVLTPMLIDGLWFTLIAFILSRPKVIAFLQNKAGLLDKVSGVLFILLAGKILFAS